jgi:hypothetical protein
VPRRIPRLPLAVVLAAAVVVVGAAFVAASSPLAPIDDPVTLRLRAESVMQRDDDVAPSGFSVGDERIRTSTVLSERVEVGRLSSICRATGTGPNTVLCAATFKLDRGQIAIQYVYRRSVFLEGKSTAVAVVGGTGAYRNVRGHGTQTRLDKVTTRFVLELEP